jgi:hypothetical protein
MNEFAARAAMQVRVRGRALVAKDGCSARDESNRAPAEVDPASEPLCLRVLAEA